MSSLVLVQRLVGAEPEAPPRRDVAWVRFPTVSPRLICKDFRWLQRYAENVQLSGHRVSRSPG